MKALLVSKGILPPKVHDLSVLDGLVKEAYPLWHWNSVELQELTTAAVEFRYPGMSATPEIAERLFEFAGAMRKELLKMIEE
jgi:HEPN domain-containing protein